MIKPLSANPTKWSNTLKQFVGKLPMNCLTVFDHFVELALKGLNFSKKIYIRETATIPKEQVHSESPIIKSIKEFRKPCSKSSTKIPNTTSGTFVVIV